MRNLDDELKNRFKNQKMDNSDFDVDGLWDAISDELDTPAVPPQKPFFNGVNRKLFGGFLFLSVLAILFLFYNSKTHNNTDLAIKNSTKAATTQNKQKTNPRANPSQQADNQQARAYRNSTQQIKTPNIVNTNQTKIVQTPSTKDTATNHTTNHSNHIDTPTSTIIHSGNALNQPIKATQSQSKNKKIHQKVLPKNQLDKNKHDGSGQSIFKNKLTSLENKNKSTTKHDITTNQNVTISETEISQKTNSPKAKAIAQTNHSRSPFSEKKMDNGHPIDTEKSEILADNSINNNQDSIVVTPFPSHQLDSVATDLANQDQSPAIKTKMPKNIHWNLSLNGGINRLFPDFNAKKYPKASTLRETYEKGSWGTSYGVNIGMAWQNKFTISTGLEYQHLWTKLDFSNQEVKTSENVLKVVWITNQGSIIALERGDKKDTISSSLVWNNEYKTYRIPLEFGYQKYYNKWTLGAKAGAIFNFTTSQEGMTFSDENQITSFTKVDDFAPLKSFQLGLRVSPTIAYQVRNKMTVQFAPQWNYYKGQTTNIQEFGLNFGLGFEF